MKAPFNCLLLICVVICLLLNSLLPWWKFKQNLWRMIILIWLVANPLLLRITTKNILSGVMFLRRTIVRLSTPVGIWKSPTRKVKPLVKWYLIAMSSWRSRTSKIVTGICLTKNEWETATANKFSTLRNGLRTTIWGHMISVMLFHHLWSVLLMFLTHGRTALFTIKTLLLKVLFGEKMRLNFLQIIWIFYATTTAEPLSMWWNGWLNISKIQAWKPHMCVLLANRERVKLWALASIRKLLLVVLTKRQVLKNMFGANTTGNY